MASISREVAPPSSTVALEIEPDLIEAPAESGPLVTGGLVATRPKLEENLKPAAASTVDELEDSPAGG